MRILPNSLLKQRFATDERGTTAVMFALMAVPMVAMIGMALDFARANNQEELMQRSLDAAILAAQSAPTDGKLTIATQYIKSNYPALAQATVATGVTPSGAPTRTINGVSGEKVTFTQVASGNVQGEFLATVTMPFASLAHLNSVDVEIDATSAPKTVVGGTKAEVAMMIDLTGSMGATRNGTKKIDGLVTAGSDILNILFPNGASSSPDVKVAIAPMADYVNAGPYAAAATGLPSTGSYAKSTNLAGTKQGPFSGAYSGVTGGSAGNQHGVVSAAVSTATYSTTFCTAGTEFEQYNGKSVGTKSSSGVAGAVYVSGKWYKKKWEDNKWKYEDEDDGWIIRTRASTCTEAADQTGPLITCVTERTGSNAYTDVSPSAGGAVGPYNKSASGSTNKLNYSADGKCYSAGRELPTIIPLTNQKPKLTAFFSGPSGTGPQIGGSTPGHLGHAWAWYMLSPNWNSVWPSASRPASYTDATTKKYAIIMTDGEYNTQYSSATSKAQALALCTSMKAAGITVYTVGFGFDSSAIGASTTDGQAKQLLKDCASGANTYYFPYDGAALRTAFSSIGSAIMGGQVTATSTDTRLTD
jgi:Flp pilus assembly protein TadG